MTEQPSPRQTITTDTNAIGPIIGTDPEPLEKFAPEPEDFGQVHKVHTQNLEWVESDCRDLKSRMWTLPLAFSLASVATSLSLTGIVEIANYSGKGSAPIFDWCLAAGGAAVGIVSAFAGFMGYTGRHTAIDKLADRIGKLRY